MGDGGEDEPAAQENTETISEIIQRLDQERIDLALANVAGDLPFVFGGRDEIRDDDREKVIVNHRTVVVAVHAAAGFLENGAPEKDSAGQRDQAEDGAQEIIPPINESVLQTEIENDEVLSHGEVPSSFLIARLWMAERKMSAAVAPTSATHISPCVSQTSP